MYSKTPNCYDCSSLSSSCSTCGSRSNFLWDTECSTCELDTNIQELRNDFGKYCADNPLNNLPNCAFVNPSKSSECSECVKGYGLNNDDECKKCQEISDGCRKCSLGEIPRCLDCKPGYGLEYDISVNEYKCISCGSLSDDCKFCRNGETTGAWGALECLETSSCASHCMSCTLSQCTSWHDGYFPSLDNPLEVSACMANCLKCSDPSTCEICKAGHTTHPSNTSCISCSTTDAECSQCTYENGELKCMSCWGEMNLMANPKYPDEREICSKSSCEEYIDCSLCSYTQCLQCQNTKYLDTSADISTCKSCHTKYTDCDECTQTECTNCMSQSAIN